MRAVAVSLIVMAAMASTSEFAHAQADKAAQAKAREHFQQGEMYFRTGVYDLAAAEYEASYALFPAPSLLYNAGLAYEQHGDIDKAIAAYGKYLAQAADNNEEKERRMEARARITKLGRTAADAAGQAEKQRRVSELRARAKTEASAGKHDAAVATYREAYELGRDAELLYEIGQVYRARGDADAAVAAYQTYREAAPAGPRSADALRFIRELTPRASESPAPTGAAASVSQPAKPEWTPKRFSFGLTVGPSITIARGDKQPTNASGMPERPGFSFHLSGAWQARRWLALGAELGFGIAGYRLENCTPCMDVGEVNMVVPRLFGAVEIAPPRSWAVLPVASAGIGIVHVGGYTAVDGMQDVQLDELFLAPVFALGARIHAGPGSIAILLRNEQWFGNLRNEHIRIDGPMQLGFVAGYVYGR
jgi:tetratricopeptide (TPR) repeat protein